MASSLEFNLNAMQVELLLAKLPKGYSLLQAQLSKSREQRILKKVNKYDATFQTTKQDVIEDKSKRSSRIAPQQKEPSKIPQNENVKKGILLLQKFKSHPAFNQVYASGYLNIDKIEASFKQEGNLLSLWNQIRLAFQKLSQNATTIQFQDLVTQLENHFYQVFKSIQPQPEQKQQQQQIKQEAPITFEEKRQLGQQIRELQPEHLKGVWEIVKKSVKTNENEELEFDIDQLPAKVIRKLQEYVSGKQNKKIKVDPSINYSSQKSINQDSSFPSESSD